MLLEFIGILAGIAIFIYSIDQLSKELLRFSNEKLKEILRIFTDHPIKAVGTGILATVLLQSSTATTSILVSLVNSGLISFSQSLGVIAGSNIGTTITAQLVAFNFMDIAFIFVIFGFLLSFLSKYRLIGKSLFLFGLVFYGLSIISTASKSLNDDAAIFSFINSITDPVYGIAIGVVLTILLQSSSVVSALAVLFAMEGLLPIAIAIPIVFGSNIGTSSTAFFVSKNMDIFAKRTAVAHMLFNISGVIIVFPFIPQFISFVSSFSDAPGTIVANAHTVFNILAAAAFLLISPLFIKLINYLTPSKEKEILFKPKYIENLSRNTDVAIDKIRLELVNHIQIGKEMFDISTEMIANRDTSKLQTIEKLESLSDYLDVKITAALVEVSQRKLTTSQSQEIINLSKIANQTEKIADIAHDYSYITIKLEENNLELSKDSINDILKIKFALDDMFNLLISDFNKIDTGAILRFSKLRRKVDTLISSAHTHRIKILSEEKLGTYATVLFVDAISSFEEVASILYRVVKNAKIVK